MKLLFIYFIFPGFLFVAISAMFVSWIERKISARIQYRVGPPLLQPYYDLRKLFFKEIVIPRGAHKAIFMTAPLFALVSLVLVFDILFLSLKNPATGFLGDLLVVIYLLMIPAIASLIGASASNNPLASLGASREMKLFFGYELPLIIALLVPVLKAKSVSLGGIINSQLNTTSNITTVSGFIAFIVALLSIQAKMAMPPFDMAEAETEISGGTQIEYSGPLLAVWKLSKMLFLVIGPVFLLALFWPSKNIAVLLARYLVFLTAAILIKNTNPRLRIDQAVKFFWGPAAAFAIISVLLALKGI